MVHFGIKKRKYYYQFEKKLFFFDPKVPNEDLEVYPGIASDKFIYLEVNWGRYEVKDLYNSFRVFKSFRPNTVRVILSLQIQNPTKAYISIDYPEYIDLFIDDRRTAKQYTYKGNKYISENILIELNIE